MFNGKMFNPGQVLPSGYSPDEAHKTGGDIIYTSGLVEKAEVIAKAVESKIESVIKDAEKIYDGTEEVVEETVEGIDLNSIAYLEAKEAYVKEKGNAKGFYQVFKASLNK